tara:strand:- start:661 stop:1998 length:1338 start_codon:yes stop_codon:yes gene_type:complete
MKFNETLSLDNSSNREQEKKQVVLQMFDADQQTPEGRRINLTDEFRSLYTRELNGSLSDEDILAVCKREVDAEGNPVSEEDRYIEGKDDPQEVIDGWHESSRQGKLEVSMNILDQWVMASCLERNTIFRIDKVLLKKLKSLKINPNILALDWRKRFFHLSDTYSFEFDNKFSFTLGFLNKRTKKEDGYNFYFQNLIKSSSNYKDENFPKNAVNRSTALEEFKKTIPATQHEYYDIIFPYVNNPRTFDNVNSHIINFADSLFFQYHHDSGNNAKQTTSSIIFRGINRDILSDCETSEEFAKKQGHDPDVIHWLLVCLQILELSHQQEFVTNNKTLTRNMRKAAKGMPKKKETATYRELTAEKIINLPRQVFLDYIKTKSKGNHVSPVGHDRAAHSRTYRHPRYVNMLNKTVTIKSSKINGGASKDRKIVYKPDSNSKLVNDFFKAS